MKLYNIVKVYTSTVGTGTVTLGSAVPSFITFATAGVVTGSTVSYAIEDGNNREVGTGTYTSGAETLTRSVVTSTNSNNLITLSGNAVVFITGLAADLSSDTANVASTLVQRDGSGNFAAGAATLSSAVVPLIIGGTGTTSTLTLRSTSGVGTTGADIIFQTGNNGATEVMRLQNGGNVGIGRSPGYKFDVNGVVSRSGDTGTASYLQIGANATDLNNYLIGCETGSFVFYQGRYGGSTSERMRIDSGGNVGIGTGSTIRSILNTHVGTITGPAVTAGLTLTAFYSGVTAVNTIDWNYSGQTASPVRLGATFNSDGSGMEMVFYTSTAYTVTGSERMRINKDGNVGIGTSGPSRTLDVNGSCIFGNVVGVVAGDSTPAQIGVLTFGQSTTSTYAWIQSWSSRPLAINPSGNNVGIGTSSPSQKLDVVGNLLLSGQSTAEQYIKVGYARSGNGFSYIDLVGDTTYAPGTRLIRGNTGANAISSLEHRGTGDLRIVNYEAAPICFYTSSSEKVRIDSSGNLLVGTTSSLAKLTAAGGTAAGAVAIITSGQTGTTVRSNSVFRIQSEATGRDVHMQFSDNVTNATEIGMISGSTYFCTGAVERMRIDSSGNIIVGNASAAVNTLRYLDLYNTDTGANAGAITRMITSDVSGTGVAIGQIIKYKNGTMSFQNTETNAAGIMQFVVGASERMRIDSSGNVKVGGTADRATTAGTNQVVIFDGTAPVGTLANGCSFYSTAGEMRVMDAAGNATLLSPHDSVTNEWIYDSSHTPSGKRLKINVERLLRFINDHFGLDCVHDLMEEA